MSTTQLMVIGGLVIALAFSVVLHQRDSARADLVRERDINDELNFSLTELQSALLQEKKAVTDLDALVEKKDLELDALSKKTKELLKNETCNSTNIPDALYDQLQLQYSH